MYCPNCGKDLVAGAKFCIECGQKIDFENITNDNQNQENSVPVSNSEPLNNSVNSIDSAENNSNYNSATSNGYYSTNNQSNYSQPNQPTNYPAPGSTKVNTPFYINENGSFSANNTPSLFLGRVDTALKVLAVINIIIIITRISSGGFGFGPLLMIIGTVLFIPVLKLRTKLLSTFKTSAKTLVIIGVIVSFLGFVISVATYESKSNSAKVDSSTPSSTYASDNSKKSSEDKSKTDNSKNSEKTDDNTIAATTNNVKSSIIASDPLNMKIGQVGEYNGVYIGLCYAKKMNALPTTFLNYTYEIPSDKYSVILFFEIYNPSDKTVSFSRSSISAYADSIAVKPSDCTYKIKVDGIEQYDSYTLDPRTRSYVVVDFEVSKNFSDLTILCGGSCTWKVPSSSVSASSFQKGKSLFSGLSAPSTTITKNGETIYSEDYTLIFNGIQNIDHDVLGETDHYVLFKFTIKNTSNKPIDYNLTGYKMRAYKDGYLLDDASYTFDDNIGGYINVYDIDSIAPGMSANVYVAFEIEDTSYSDYYMAYDTGYIASDLIAYVYIKK